VFTSIFIRNSIGSDGAKERRGRKVKRGSGYDVINDSSRTYQGKVTKNEGE